MNQRILILPGLLLLPLAAPAQTELPVRIEPFLQQVAEYDAPIEADAPPAAPASSPTSAAGVPGEVREVATDADTLSIAVASSDGVYLRSGSETVWRRLFPREGDRSWAPVDVQAVEFDYHGKLWFASPQGLGAVDADTGAWRLYDRTDGLPWNDFTSLAAAPDRSIWAGTTRGLIHLIPGTSPADPPRWQYRQGRRWLPDDHVLAVEVEPDGAVRVETRGGPGTIHMRPMTLRQKADHFDRQIDRFHRRTPYGYVGGVALERAGDPSAFTRHDSDNDGLWTAMYGAAECFRWAVTGDPEARERARQAFEALRFLQLVSRDGTPPALPGFVARSILPVDGPDPNAGQAERDRQMGEERDGLWKVIDPRWPTSADGKWYWKSDTSSDELDGHFFFYGLYYDLVAADDAERAEVRETVLAIVDHLVDFIHAAAIDGASYRDAFDDETYSRGDFPLDDAVESLVLYPLDRFDWALSNSHRHDILLLREPVRRELAPHANQSERPSSGARMDQEERRGPRGHLIDERVLPIDERFVNHWNHDPWRLDHGGQGRYLADGASFLLPYYLGLYHGLIEETVGEAGTEAAE